MFLFTSAEVNNPVQRLKQRRHLLSLQRITCCCAGYCFFAIGYCRPRDENTIMASAAAVRSSVGLTLRLSRVIPDCRKCPLYRLKTCVNSVANLQRSGSFDSLRTINRHLQTTIGEFYTLLILLALIGDWVLSLSSLRGWTRGYKWSTTIYSSYSFYSALAWTLLFTIRV